MKKTKKLITSVILSLGASSLAGCSDDLPAQPDDNSCTEWDWDDELGVWECDDSRSPHFGYFFFGGRSYKSKSDLLKSSSFQSYKSSPNFKGGFGSGSKGGFGG